MRCTLPLVITLMAASAPPQIASEGEYRERMEEIDHAFTELQKHGTVRAGESVGEEAEKLSELFEEVHAFWKSRGDEEAAGFARMAKEGAEAVREADHTGQQETLDAAIATIASSCEGCHRDPLDKYRFRKE